MMEQLTVIKQTQEQRTEAIADFSSRILSLESKIAGLEQLKEAVSVCKKDNETQTRMLRTLRPTVDELENRSRRCYLIFYGVNDAHAQESSVESEKLVSDICKSHLGIDSVTLEQARRLGK